MAEEITVWSKIFPHSQMTETSVPYRLHAYDTYDTCTLSSVCYVKVDSRYGNIHLCKAAESAFGLLTFRLLPNIKCHGENDDGWETGRNLQLREVHVKCQ
jgi:hypothetical protein